MRMRDLTIERRNVESGKLSYKMTNRNAIPSVPEQLAYRFSKHLLSDTYGGLLTEVGEKKMQADVMKCIKKTHKHMERFRGVYPDTIYGAYHDYKVRNIEINPSTMALIIEIDVKTSSGAVATVSL